MVPSPRNLLRLLHSRVACRLTLVANLVFLAIFHLCNRARWSHGPSVRDVQNGQSVEIKRIRVPPVHTAVFADVLAVRPGRGQRDSVNPRDRGTKSTGLLRSQCPSLARVL